MFTLFVITHNYIVSNSLTVVDKSICIFSPFKPNNLFSCPGNRMAILICRSFHMVFNPYLSPKISKLEPCVFLINIQFYADLLLPFHQTSTP